MLRAELTVHNVTLQLEDLWDRHGENYHIKLLRGPSFPGDFPPAIPQGNVSYVLLIGHVCTWMGGKAAGKYLTAGNSTGKMHTERVVARGTRGNGFPLQL